MPRPWSFAWGHRYPPVEMSCQVGWHAISCATMGERAKGGAVLDVARIKPRPVHVAVARAIGYAEVLRLPWRWVLGEDGRMHYRLVG